MADWSVVPPEYKYLTQSPIGRVTAWTRRPIATAPKNADGTVPVAWHFDGHQPGDKSLDYGLIGNSGRDAQATIEERPAAQPIRITPPPAVEFQAPEQATNDLTPLPYQPADFSAARIAPQVTVTTDTKPTVIAPPAPDSRVDQLIANMTRMEKLLAKLVRPIKRPAKNDKPPAKRPAVKAKARIQPALKRILDKKAGRPVVEGTRYKSVRR